LCRPPTTRFEVRIPGLCYLHDHERPPRVHLTLHDAFHNIKGIDPTNYRHLKLLAEFRPTLSIESAIIRPMPICHLTGSHAVVFKIGRLPRTYSFGSTHAASAPPMFHRSTFDERFTEYWFLRVPSSSLLGACSFDENPQNMTLKGRAQSQTS
jgi:hypothetical protein